MAFENSRGIKTGFLKLTVDVAGVDKSTQRCRVEPFFQHCETSVRQGSLIEICTVGMKAPREMRIAFKNCGAGQILVLEILVCKQWIRGSEARLSAKGGKSRLNTDARAGGSDDRICRSNKARCAINDGGNFRVNLFRFHWHRPAEIARSCAASAAGRLAGDAVTPVEVTPVKVSLKFKTISKPAGRLSPSGIYPLRGRRIFLR